MTKIELLQAIDNLSECNSNGCYDERILQYKDQLLIKNSHVKAESEIFSASAMEFSAIRSFNADKRFKITE